MQSLVTPEGHTGRSAQHTCRPLRPDQARDAATKFLTALDPPPPESTIQNVLLLVSELVTNALRHAGAVTSLKLRADRARIQVTVEDPSPAQPRGRTPDWTGCTGGFGWPMIQRLAQSLTIVPARPGAGKAIIAALPR
ncbi:ATP-binding protein [Streptomyces sp. NBC_01426]|uniref:ATP-binding protein n=1 Tax=Streptomyces sp. NBC_01426 TaxID=2975866 RepID=UPI002E2EF453|nr:ATP-binding protein [Streptomyces sp. NBC_01426]